MHNKHESQKEEVKVVARVDPEEITVDENNQPKLAVEKALAADHQTTDKRKNVEEGANKSFDASLGIED